MSARDWMELAWHAALLVLVSGAVLNWLATHKRSRLALGGVVAVALVYHVAVVQACHMGAPLCYWNL